MTYFRNNKLLIVLLILLIAAVSFIFGFLFAKDYFTSQNIPVKIIMPERAN